jgi:type II secretory pathway pseudopilin PulG
MKIDKSGQILVEVLVAMAIASVVVVLGSQLIFISLAGNKISGDNNTASGLAEETFEAARAATAENWLNVYSLTHGSVQYYPQKTAGAWTLVAGAESVSLNSSYNRYFTLQNVCRDISTKVITGVSDNGGSAETCNDISGSRIDPSTQKINVSVSWPGGSVVSESDYLTRWRNKACLQTSWTSAGGSVYDCPSAFYGSTDGNIITGENLHL